MTGPLLALLLAGQASATRIAVLDVQVNEDLEVSAQLLTESLAEGVARRGHEVVSPQDVAALMSLEGQRQKLGCTDDMSCLAEIAGALDVEWIVTSTLDLLGSRWVATAKLVHVPEAKVTHRLRRHVDNATYLASLMHVLGAEVVGATPDAVAFAEVAGEPPGRRPTRTERPAPPHDAHTVRPEDAEPAGPTGPAALHAWQVNGALGGSFPTFLAGTGGQTPVLGGLIGGLELDFAVTHDILAGARIVYDLTGSVDDQGNSGADAVEILVADLIVRYRTPLWGFEVRPGLSLGYGNPTIVRDGTNINAAALSADVQMARRFGDSDFGWLLQMSLLFLLGGSDSAGQTWNSGPLFSLLLGLEYGG